MKVGICTIIKDCDENYLKEFVEWHKLIGVDYFFIYDNESKIPIKETLKDIDGIYVFEIVGTKMLFPAYRDFINSKITNHAYPKCDWVAFIDDDEYMLPECGNIKEVLADYNEYSGLAINWHQFGSSGLLTKTPESQKEKFIMATPIDSLTNRHVKTIARPETLDFPLNPHIFQYKRGICVDINKAPITTPLSDKPIHEKLWINHYFCRSKEEYLAKMRRGNVDDGGTKPEVHFLIEDSLSTVMTTQIQDLYIKLKNIQ